MAFINSAARLRALGPAIAFGLLLAGCSGLPQKDSTEQNAAPTPAEGAPFVAQPNPYLQQEVAVPPAAQSAFNEALVAMQAEDWATAETRLTALTQNYPTLAGPWVNLGIVYRNKNQLQQAENAFNKAIEVNPLNNDAYNELGVLLREQGRFEEAEANYKKALAVWPHSPVTLRNLGILYDLYMGRFEEALSSYELALKVSPEPSRELEGWIIDIKRRMAAEARS